MLSTLKHLLVIGLTFVSLPVFALEGWNLSIQEHALVYTPKDLKSDQFFQYSVFGPFEVEEDKLRNWFTKQVEILQNNLGKPREPWKVIRDQNAWRANTRFLGNEGNAMSVSYYGGSLENNQAFIVQLLSYDEFFLQLKYGVQFYNVRNNAVDILNNLSSTSKHLRARLCP
jgi:hypothetical protein